MIVEFRCDRERARQWMVGTTLPLENQSTGVQIAWAETASPAPVGLDALFELEHAQWPQTEPVGTGADRTPPEVLTGATCQENDGHVR